MKAPVMERLLLGHAERVRNISDDTSEIITQIIERTRIEQGHLEAEARAKEIRELIETGISESELAKKLIEERKHM